MVRQAGIRSIAAPAAAATGCTASAVGMRVVEQAHSGAVVEVACSCGRKT